MSSPAQVRIQHPDGSIVGLGVGGIIGRVWSADLQLNHPAVSEVHAYVSLRRGALQLLPLRGRLWLYGLEVQEVVLEAGMRVELAPGVEISILDVALSPWVPALQVGGQVVPLRGGVVAVGAGGTVQSGADPEAIAMVWSTGDQWFIQPNHAAVQRLDEGEVHHLGALQLRLIRQDLSGAEVAPTIGADQRKALRIVARFDSVQIHRDHLPVVRISGVPARLLTVLAELDGPVHWEVAAREVWARVSDRVLLRQRWDRALWSLRRKLEAANVRADLVRTSGGSVELVLQGADRCEVSG